MSVLVIAWELVSVGLGLGLGFGGGVTDLSALLGPERVSLLSGNDIVIDGPGGGGALQVEVTEGVPDECSCAETTAVDVNVEEGVTDGPGVRLPDGSATPEGVVVTVSPRVREPSGGAVPVAFTVPDPVFVQGSCASGVEVVVPVKLPVDCPPGITCVGDSVSTAGVRVAPVDVCVPPPDWTVEVPVGACV